MWEKLTCLNYYLAEYYKYYFKKKRNLSIYSINPWDSRSYTVCQRQESIKNLINWIQNTANSFYTNRFGLSVKNTHRINISEVITTLHALSEIYPFNQDKYTENLVKLYTNWLLLLKNEDDRWLDKSQQNNNLTTDVTNLAIIALIAAYRCSGDKRCLQESINSALLLCDDDYKLNDLDKNKFATKLQNSVLDAHALMDVYYYDKKNCYESKIISIAESLNRNLVYENGWVKTANTDSSRVEDILLVINVLIRTGKLFKKDEIYERTLNTLYKFFTLFNNKKYIVAEYKSDWHKECEYISINSYAMLSELFYEMYKHTSDIQYVNTGLKINDFIISRQFNCKRIGFFGAIPKTFPSWIYASQFTIYDAKLAIISFIKESEIIYQLNQL